ncbi:MAG: VWA domain-containing protein [Bacteroides sp.]|nr:VWA domain-containing protein [Bacteroides sp.]
MINHISIKYRTLTIISALLCVMGVYAQRERNNIYLFDCTGSMQTNGLWQPAKNALEATITTQSAIPGSQFIVIPFGDNPYTPFTFNSSGYQKIKSDINKDFDKHIEEAKYTRITDVLQAGFSKVDANKENKIYLLTDGMPNAGDTPEKVADAITKWCGNHRNCRLFYVALTNGVVNPVIQRAIDGCPDAFIVQCEDKIIPQIADISSEVYTNLEELSNWREISFNLPGNYEISGVADDQLFDVKIKDGSANGGKILISLSPKHGQDLRQLHQTLQGKEHALTVKLQCTDKHYFIANPVVTVHVSDEVPSKLNIAGGKEEIGADGVKWYDSFWWSGAAADQKVEWDLSPVFENELANSNLQLKLEIPAGEGNDFQVWYNETPVNNGDVMTIVPGSKAMVQVQFENNAREGKRYLSLVPVASEGLDMINGMPIADYEGTSLRTSYSIGWNPLKTFMVWLSVALVALLILWTVVLRRIFFPAIKISKVEFTGPGTYYASKKIKGTRKVVLTSDKKSQNFLSRFFTGEIRYVRAEHFSPALSIFPAGGKKKVKLRQEGGKPNSWNIYPSNIFSQYDKGTLINQATGDKTNIDFS